MEVENAFLDSNNHLQLDDDMLGLEYLASISEPFPFTSALSLQPPLYDDSVLFGTLTSETEKMNVFSPNPSPENATGNHAKQFTNDHSSPLSENPPPTTNTHAKSSRRPRQGTGQFQCGFDGCTRSYKRQFELNRHQQIHSSIRSHECRFMACNRSGRNGFTRKDHLRQHLRQVHGVSS